VVRYVPTFRRNTMQVAGSSEPSVPIYLTTWCHISEERTKIEDAGSSEPSVPIYLTTWCHISEERTKMEDAGSSEPSVPIYLTTWCHISQHSNLQLFSQLIVIQSHCQFIDRLTHKTHAYRSCSSHTSRLLSATAADVRNRFLYPAI